MSNAELGGSLMYQVQAGLGEYTPPPELTLEDPQPPKRMVLVLTDEQRRYARNATPADLDRLGYRQDKHLWHGKYAAEILRELHIAGVIALEDPGMQERDPELQKKIHAWLTCAAAWAKHEASE